MTSRSRQLRTKEKRHIRLSGLKPRDMVRWANVNLIDWLNGSKAESAGCHRIIEIIDLARQAHLIAAEAGPAVSNDEYFSCKRRVGTVLSKLNVALARYSCKAEICFYGASLHRKFLFAAESLDTKPEVLAVAFLIENLPVIHRVRRCSECQRWFWGITEHQRFCKDSCRKRHAAHGAEFLEQRRIYMRDYRRTQRELDLRSKIAVKGGMEDGTRKTR